MRFVNGRLKMPCTPKKKRASVVSVHNHSVLVGSRDYLTKNNISKSLQHYETCIHLKYTILIITFSQYEFIASHFSSHGTHTQTLSVSECDSRSKLVYRFMTLDLYFMAVHDNKS